MDKTSCEWTLFKKRKLEILEKALAEAKVGDQHDPPKGPMTESADVSDDAYIDGMRAQKTVELLEELSKGSDQPFFRQLECLNHIYRSLPQKNIGICMTVMILKCRQMQGFLRDIQFMRLINLHQK